MTSNDARLRPVLVGFDGSDSALDAVAWAAREAESRGVDLHIVLAYSWLGTAVDDIQARREAHRLLQSASDVARGVLPQGRVRTALASGGPDAALLFAARGCSLLVVGHTQEGFVRDLLAPSLSSRLTEAAPVPVVLMGYADPTQLPESPAALPVTVGLTESNASRAAAIFAANEALSRHVPLQVVHIVPEAGARSLRVEGFLEHLVTAYPSLAVSFQRPVGRPAPRLLELSGRSSLLVIGTHGATSVHRHPLGLVLDQLAHRAQCPVAVVGPRSAAQPSEAPWSMTDLAASAR